VSDEDKVLIVGPSWVGDMVMAQSLYRQLCQDRPSTVLHVIAPSWSLPIIARMPEVTRGIELVVAHREFGFGKRRTLGRALQAEHYSQAIILPRSWKAALVPYFARIPRRTGFRGEWRYGLVNDMRLFDPVVLSQTVKRFVALGIESGQLPAEILAPALKFDEGRAAMLADRHGLDLGKLAVAMMPGAEYGPAKRWPVEQFAELAARLDADGVEVWVLGSLSEYALGEAIVERAPAARNLCGATELTDVIDLLAAARAAVTNDSGLMHIAAAVRTRVIALYGSTTPAFTPPLSDQASIIYRALDCSPCFERSCPLGHLNCLRSISVDDVFVELSERLVAA
jgi:heptosyltransferase-2